MYNWTETSTGCFFFFFFPQKYPVNISLIPVGNVFWSSCSSLMAILCPHCSTHRRSPNTAKQTQQSTVKPTAAWWVRCVWLWWTPGPEKTTSWNYQSAPSYSVFIVLASGSAAARQPGCFSWWSWMLAPVLLLAISLSAPGEHCLYRLGERCRWCRPGSGTISSSLSLCPSLLHFWRFDPTTCNKMWGTP